MNTLDSPWTLSSKYEKYLFGVLGAMYTAGALGLFFKPTKLIFQILTPFHLLAVVIFLFSAQKIDKRLVIYILGIALMGFSIEYLGVKTGILFGVYDYDKTLGFKVMEVPPLIGVNWLIMVYIGTITGFHIFKEKSNRLLIALFCGLSITAIDYFVEPVATKTDMWTWEGGSPPLQNFICWFIFGTSMSYIFQPFLNHRYNCRAVFVFGLQLFFFAFLYFFL
jgi:bisanhydrobacterioruberin hydratase